MASWGVIFPQIDSIPRHPSQLYESFLEGIVLFIILNIILFKKNIKLEQYLFIFNFLWNI